MSTDARPIQFICVNAAHHRRGTARDTICEHLGCDAFCPAGDVGHHDWMLTSTDLGSLGCLGYLPSGTDDEDESAPHADDRQVLIKA